MYNQLKKEKAQEIVTLLDLFDGKITLSEILNTDLTLINQLRDAKLEIKKKQELDKQKVVELTPPEEIAKKVKS